MFIISLFSVIVIELDFDEVLSFLQAENENVIVNANINTKKLDKEIQELENQRARIKEAYIKGIVKLRSTLLVFPLVKS